VTANLWIYLLLGACVVVCAICCLALAILRDFYVRLHYLAPVATVAFLALLIAVIIREGAGQSALKTILVFAALLLINAVLTHATARAARVRQLGHWTASPDEGIPGSSVTGE
jgi:monovalent cation/proton antiporter MnhG/PhaG subunit